MPQKFEYMYMPHCNGVCSEFLKNMNRWLKKSLDGNTHEQIDKLNKYLFLKIARNMLTQMALFLDADYCGQQWISKQNIIAEEIYADFDKLGPTKASVIFHCLL